MRGSVPSILVLDQGNTRLKIGRFQRGRLVDSAAFGPEAIDQAHAFADQGPVDRMVLANIGRIDAGLRARLQGLAPMVEVRADGPSPLVNRYRSALTLGVDRLANAVAAHRSFPGRPSLAIGAGTCITYDLTTADATYRGGAISPGLHMRALAMHTLTARLPLVDPPDGPEVFATDTVGSLGSGIHHGLLFEVIGYIRAFRQQHPDGAVVVTGGDALRIVRGVKSSIFAHPTLTLLGLYALHDHQLALDPPPTALPGPAGLGRTERNG